MQRRIAIVDYNPDWPNQFEQYKSRIQSALADKALKVDHIGSTSVPGLAAKDVIDIQITVADIEDEAIVHGLTEVGFVFRAETNRDCLTGFEPDSIELKKCYFREPQGEREVHVHVRELGRVNQAYPLLFRDYLRVNHRAAQTYESLKKLLASRFEFERSAYNTIKDPCMDLIYQAAKLWARQVNWQPE